MSIVVKTCIKCGGSKPLHEFYSQPGMRDGRRNDCKQCMNDARKLRYRANRDVYIRRAQQWKRDNRERYREGQRRRRLQRGPIEIRRERDQHLQRTYGLTLEDYEFLLVSQRGRCTICGKPDGDQLHVDHDHLTGRVRGLLCGNCNRAMGLFHEDAARFEAAGEYLRRPQLPLGAGDREKRPVRRVRLPSSKPPGESS